MELPLIIYAGVMTGFTLLLTFYIIYLVRKQIMKSSCEHCNKIHDLEGLKTDPNDAKDEFDFVPQLREKFPSLPQEPRIGSEYDPDTCRSKPSQTSVRESNYHVYEEIGNNSAEERYCEMVVEEMAAAFSKVYKKYYGTQENEAYLKFLVEITEHLKLNQRQHLSQLRNDVKSIYKSYIEGQKRREANEIDFQDDGTYARYIPRLKKPSYIYNNLGVQLVQKILLKDSRLYENFCIYKVSRTNIVGKKQRIEFNTVNDQEIPTSLKDLKARDETLQHDVEEPDGILTRCGHETSTDDDETYGTFMSSSRRRKISDDSYMVYGKKISNRSPQHSECNNNFHANSTFRYNSPKTEVPHLNDQHSFTSSSEDEAESMMFTHQNRLIDIHLPPEDHYLTLGGVGTNTLKKGNK